MALRGLLVSILRDASGGDCTLNGVTSPARAPRGMAILLGIPDGNWVEGDLPKDLPVLVVRKRVVCGEEYVDAVPYGEKRHVMAGGNFVYTSDGRFRAVCQYPISVHDRVEV
jgi:hypothetical protein